MYALTAISLLYLALLNNPFIKTFQNFPINNMYQIANPAIVVAALYFALLHASFAFFGELGGFNGLFYLGSTYLFGVTLSFTALIVLSLMAALTFKKVARKIPSKFRAIIPTLSYLAGILTIIHALTLGGDFTTLSSTIPQIMFSAAAFLFILLAYQFDLALTKKFTFYPRFGVVLLIVIIFVIGGIYFLISPSSSNLSFNIHAAHIALAKQIQQQQQQGTSSVFTTFSNIPGLDGDRTKRYTASFNNPDGVMPKTDTTLSFKIYDADSGSVVPLLKVLYAKIMHIVIVDSSLTYFSHIHPTQIGDEFDVTTQFPHDGQYRIYITFQPYGGIEQQVGFTQDVGNAQNPTTSTQPLDKNMTKTFGKYEVTLDMHGGLNAQAMSIGQQTISFTIRDAVTKKPITTLKPYLAAFGHLTMINEKTYYFIHVHPYSLTIPPPNSNGGPTVDFLPIGIYGAFKPGIYRMFAEFNPDNNLFTADYTVKVN